MIRRPPRSTLFPYTTPSDLLNAEAPKELVLDTNFDEVNIVRLLGLKRVKKLARKSKKKKDRKSTRLKLQSHHDLVCRLLLEKKNMKKKKKNLISHLLSVS